MGGTVDRGVAARFLDERRVARSHDAGASWRRRATDGVADGPRPGLLDGAAAPPQQSLL